VVRPWGWPEAVVAVPAAGVVIGTGAISLGHARAEARRLGPVVWFLAAVLVLAQLCDDEGLFTACGAWMARAAAGRPRRLLACVFAAASVTTAVLSLDATIVLLTPVVFATAARLGARPRPHVYACTHLSNTASVLLAGLQPDQPAGVRCQRAELHPLRRADGTAVAGSGRHRIRGLPAVLRY
jgi:arsenical pump membrane protein